TSTTTLDSAATPLSGTTLFYERMLTGRFGLGLTFSSFLERSFQLTIGTDIYDILETVTAMSFDFKTYFSEHKKEGWKTYMGVSFGQYTVASTIVKTDSNGATTDGKTGATVPTTSLSFGVDYVLEFGGFRMDTAIINGKRYDKTGFDLHDAVYDYSTTTVVELGVFSFF
ncbi:MAG: hypothetical protein OEY59_12780, partial [Deltaproteobacteria bacterium]|nr:hypothetical protein [Deltaproteobacteria bacterium]